MKKVYSTLFLCILFCFGFSQNPRLDTSFGDNGFFQQSYGEAAVKIASSARQSDGKIILAGFIEKQVHSLQSKSYFESNWEAFVGRILPTGILDSTFGENGFITASEGNLNDRYDFVHTDSTDRIYVMGNLQFNRIIGRYLPDGQIDSTYGMDGFFHPAHLLNGSNNVVNDVILMNIEELHVRPNGDIYLLDEVGSAFLGITKFNSSGILDSSFGYAAQVRLRIENSNTYTHSLHFLTGDSILALATHGQRISSIKLDPQGNLAYSFHGTGHINQIIPEGGSIFTKLRQDSQGNIWAAGASYWATDLNPFGVNSVPHNLLTQISADGKRVHMTYPRSFPGLNSGLTMDMIPLPDGSAYFAGTERVIDSVASKLFVSKMLPSGIIDSSFGQGGFFRFNPAIQENKGKIGQVLRLQPDGKILLGATLGTDLFFDPKMCLIRLLPNGLRDTSFNTVGYRIMGNPAAFQRTRDMELLPDGSILIGGQLASVDALSLAKALPNGERDLQFATNGFAQSIINGNGNFHGGYFAVKSNGKIIQVASKAEKIHLLQYQANGSLDQSFANNGRRNVTARSFCTVRDVAIAPGGDILVVGDFPFGTTSQAFIMCMDENGIPKNSFGNNGFYAMDIPGNTDYGFSLLPLANGDLLLGGAAGNQATIVRLLRNLVLSTEDLWSESDPFSPFIYPNPIRSYAKLQLDLNHAQEVKVSLLTLQGQRIDQLYSVELFSGKQELDLSFPSHLSQGYYLLKIQSEKEVAFIKIFVK